jgi:hypothetical protein
MTSSPKSRPANRSRSAKRSDFIVSRPQGGDWQNPDFASSEFEDTGEAHIFGDVVIAAHAIPPVKRPNKG